MQWCEYERSKVERRWEGRGEGDGVRGASKRRWRVRTDLTWWVSSCDSMTRDELSGNNNFYFNTVKLVVSSGTLSYDCQKRQILINILCFFLQNTYFYHYAHHSQAEEGGTKFCSVCWARESGDCRCLALICLRSHQCCQRSQQSDLQRSISVSAVLGQSRDVSSRVYWNIKNVNVIQTIVVRGVIKCLQECQK